MWYVMQVRTGTEENIRQQCTARIPGSILQNCFIPCYEEKKKKQRTMEYTDPDSFSGLCFSGYRRH